MSNKCWPIPNYWGNGDEDDYSDEDDYGEEECTFDQDENGNSKSGENYKTIQYEKLVPLLVEAIKEQQKQIAQLSETIDNLVNK